MSWLLPCPETTEATGREKRRYRTYGAADDGFVETATLQLTKKFEGASFFVVNHAFIIACLFPYFILALGHYWNDFSHYTPFLNAKPSVPLMTDHEPVRRKTRKISQGDSVYINDLVGDILNSLLQSLIFSTVVTLTLFGFYKWIQIRRKFETTQIFYTSLIISFCSSFVISRIFA